MDNKTDMAILLRVDPWIFRLDGLSLFEKCLLNYVYSWTLQGRCCFTPDDWLAHKFGFQPSDVKTSLELLEFKGYIKINKGITKGLRSLSFVFSDAEDVCLGVNSPEEAFQII